MKIKTKLKACFVCILSIATGVYAGNAVQSGVHAEQATVTFTATVRESLSVTIDQSAISSTGAINNFLTNHFTVTVGTNNAAGYTASMRSADSNIGTNKTDLVNTDEDDDILSTIATLADSDLTDGWVARNAFPTNKWGYSLDNANYRPMTNSSSVWINSYNNAITASASDANSSKTVYFGTKVDASKAAGTYTNDVLVNVVTGYSAPNNNPTIPDNPTGPVFGPTDDTDQTNNTATPVEKDDVTNSVYVRPGSPAGKTETQIISGSYSDPLGATQGTYYTSSNVSGGSSLATGLAVASATAVVSGGLFFLLSKSRRDDDDDY